MRLVSLPVAAFATTFVVAAAARAQAPAAPAAPAPAATAPAATDAPAPAPTAAEAAPQLAPPVLDDGASSDNGLRLRSIQERVNELKEKIFQSKARLIQLQEVVLHGSVSGSKAVLTHKNEMGSSFRLTRVQYALDGAPIFNRIDSGNGELNEQETIEIFNGSIAPGNHQISVYLEYKGHGYGIFSYLQGYTFKIKSSYSLTAEEGKSTNVTIVGYEQGGITTQLKDRPAVRYDVEMSRELRPNTPAGDAPASATEGKPTP